jgi:hypothetical protein
MRRLIVFALLLLLAPGCKKQPAQSARVDPALAPLIPSDTILLAGLRLDRMKETRFYRTWVEGRKIAVLEDFAARTGLDPRRDIYELNLAYNGARSLVFIRGKFGGLFGFEPEFKQPGLQRTSYKGLYILHTGGSGVLFMNTGAAVAGPVEELKAIVDNREKPQERPPQALLDLVAQVPGAAHAWAVTTNAARLLPTLPQNGELSNITKLAQSVGPGKLHLDLTDSFVLQAEARCADETSARQLRDTVKAVVGIGRLKTPGGEPDLLRFFDGFRPASDGNRFTLRIEEPFDLIQLAMDRYQSSFDKASGKAMKKYGP